MTVTIKYFNGSEEVFEDIDTIQQNDCKLHIFNYYDEDKFEIANIDKSAIKDMKVEVI